jgi:hypothetical protein
MTTIILVLIAMTVGLYFVGGQKWAHTLFRDLGCSLCIYALATMLFGWNWLYLAGFAITVGGFTIGDHDGWQWSIHGFVVGLGLCTVSIWGGLAVAFLSAGLTYLVSRFTYKGGWDVLLRGLIYGTLPLWFLIKG